ncbi:helix-turn-helix transcriptional regulator [Rubrivivax gelatinosus]|uniref:Transcriptional regulator YbtA n=1 Tax=Rubrivivax gelatinosus (strain NBRC 100245 / IL144) TaxID=983917 RepID=I0HLP8_RUBGI|nr:AraC family transcriptional regulator [Rubrivivax gelatinosus]BAL93935.1 transcriptional regulator YbtA [Rubrivivax gelatinosus IL144]
MSHAASPHPVEVEASDLLERHEQLDFGRGAWSRLSIVGLQEGVALLGWQAGFDSPCELRLRDDSDAVHFGYALRGRSRCRIEHGRRREEHDFPAARGHLHYGPDSRGRFLQHGEYCSVSVMLRPALLRAWAGEDRALQRALDDGHCLAHGLHGRELHAVAQSLHQALQPGAPPRHALWLQGQALAFVGLCLEARRDGEAADLGADERRRLLQARDRLLSDLAAPPLLADLAATHGLSVLRLQRGFRALFGCSAYALFQRERMHEARRRLLAGEARVTDVALELGYTNLSHFAAAFRREFGLAPGCIAGRRRA